MAIPLAADRWRRPGCGASCWRKPVLVIGDRFKQILEVHDPDAHEAYVRDGRAAAGTTETGSLIVDHDNQIAYLHTVPLNLTQTETAILLCLARRVGLLCSHAHVLTAVWGPDYRDEHHLIRVNIARLRAKLGADRALIETRLGFGYTLLQALPV